MVALLLAVLLEGTHEGSLVLGSLEPSMSELGAGVDELEADLLQGPLLGVGQERLPQGEGALLGANAATLAGQGQLGHGKTAKSNVKKAVSNYYLDHDEVLLDLSVMGESSHGVDGLVSNVIPFKRKCQQCCINSRPLHANGQDIIVRKNSQVIFMEIKW